MEEVGVQPHGFDKLHSDIRDLASTTGHGKYIFSITCAKNFLTWTKLKSAESLEFTRKEEFSGDFLFLSFFFFSITRGHLW